MVKLIEDASEIPSNKAVILDFYADWCGPCKMIAPKFMELEANFPSVTFLKANVDDSEALAEQFGVRAMPTFVCLLNGNIVGRVEGADLKKIIHMLEELERA
jgi:thioredoxin 1